MTPTAKSIDSPEAVALPAPSALFTLAATALLAPPQGASPAAAASTPKPAAMPVKLSVFSPGVRDTAGKDGAGFVIDLSLTARNRAANALLSPEAGYKPFFNNPTAPTFVPGADAGAPGLVVTLSTTPNMPGTPFQGPNTNLAGLFQINGVGTVKGGLTQTWNTWQIGKAGFGSGPSTLTAFVVKGTAPAVVPDTGLERISNTVTIPFTITSPAAATPPPAAASKRERDVEGDERLQAREPPRRRDRPDRVPLREGSGHHSACTGACANTWPALRATGP